MTWRWLAQFGSEASAGPGPGKAFEVPESFSTQVAAEVWLTSSYADQADQGVRAVSLYEEDRLVYGPMSLDAG